MLCRKVLLTSLQLTSLYLKRSGKKGGWWREGAQRVVREETEKSRVKREEKGMTSKHDDRMVRKDADSDC